MMLVNFHRGIKSNNVGDDDGSADREREACAPSKQEHASTRGWFQHEFQVGPVFLFGGETWGFTKKLN